MRVFISADIEGCTGVTTWDETFYGKPGYAEAAEQMNKEVAAAARGAIAAGADEVVVKDGHEDAMNIQPSAMPRGVRVLRGWTQDIDAMMAGVGGGFDCAFYIGYHAEAGSSSSPLSHTTEFPILQKALLNGKPMAEFDVNALAAARHGVPSALITGDKGICDKAAESCPWIKTVAVKEGVSGGTLNMHPEEACELIEEAAKAAVSEKNFKCAEIPEHFEMELTYKYHTRAKKASTYPGAVLKDDCTVTYETDDVADLLEAYSFMV